MKKNLLYILIIIVFTSARAQSAPPVEYELSFDGVLDNREYGGAPARDETYFFARPEAEIGFRLDDSHKIMGGLTYKQEFGAPKTADNLHLLMYYHYKDSGDGGNTQFRFGAFPRVGALDLPEWFFGDDAVYSRPFVHGAALEIKRWGAEFSAWVDWTGRQADTVREAFLFGYGAGYGYGMFFARHDFMMYHLAAPGIPVPDDHVKDNGGLSVEAGIARGRAAFIDFVTFSIGGIVSFDRDRRDNIWHTPAGGFVRGEASKSRFALRGTAYVGEPQRLVWGDSFYRLNSFGRIDLIARFVNRTDIKADFFPSIHIFDKKVGFSQHFLLSVKIGND